MFILGPKASGKTLIAQNVADRTNMTLINFDQFVEANDLKDTDDERKMMALLSALSRELKPRVIIENFP
jgi:shikimate kinase